MAHIVWPRFGDVPNYIEPFFGSGAILLKRPPEWTPRVETANDSWAFIANFWRAVQADPDLVAYYADFPVNESDLHSRHRWLVEQTQKRIRKIKSNPHYYCAKTAGWWVWGQCLWIGSGWCVSDRRRRNEYPAGQEKRPHLSESGFGRGVHRKLPQFDRGGRGIAGPSIQGELRRHANGTDADNIVDWEQRPDLSSPYGRGLITERSPRMGYGPDQERRPQLTNDTGVIAIGNNLNNHKRPHLATKGGVGVHRKHQNRGEDAMRVAARRGGTGVNRRWNSGGAGGGQGVHSPTLTQQIPQLSGDGSGAQRGVLSDGILKSIGLYEYMFRLQERMRRVRVCCGDWSRVVTPAVTTYIGTTAVFLDPPYKQELRELCYAHDHDISDEVRAWAIANGDNPAFRIALCGYEDEHGPHMPANWECVPWKAGGGYGRTSRGVENRARERLWFSPHCLKPSLPLFPDDPSVIEVEDEPSLAYEVVNAEGV